MNVVEIAVRFVVAWLAFGLGLFVATGSLRALHPVTAGHGATWRPLYVLPLLLALGVLVLGLVGAMRAVPW